VSRVCYICNKKPLVGNNVSHSHKKSKRVFLPNLQSIKIDENGSIRKRKVCTQCLKSGKVKKYVAVKVAV
jgi:large subunit ribosomal protein L28